jgi:hypothetical protein
MQPYFPALLAVIEGRDLAHWIEAVEALPREKPLRLARRHRAPPRLCDFDSA